jgi:hypothetical protein
VDNYYRQAATRLRYTEWNSIHGGCEFALVSDGAEFLAVARELAYRWKTDIHFIINHFTAESQDHSIFMVIIQHGITKYGRKKRVVKQNDSKGCTAKHSRISILPFHY